MQVQSLDPAARAYRSSWHCLQSSIQSEGVRGLFVGYVPCVIRAVFVNACIFTAVVAAKRALDMA